MEQHSIGDRLRELRTAKNVNQDQAAEACGISRIALARYETGTRVPRAEMASRLADYYDVTVDYILGREEAPAEEKESTFNVNTQQDRDPIFDAIAKLNPENRALVDQMARKLLESQRRNSGT